MKCGVTKLIPLILALIMIISGTANAVMAGDYDTGSGNPATENGNGLVLVNSGNNTLTGNIATGNTVNGIVLESSDNNNLSGNVASGNTYGIVLINASDNVIAGNNVSRNVLGGIESLTGSNNNTMYNNYPDNSTGAGGDTSGTGTVRNTTSEIGNTIAGCPSTGGTSWALPDGNGWSLIYRGIAMWFAPS